MGVIVALSGDILAARETGSWLLPLLGAVLPWMSPSMLHALHVGLRKLGHLVEYGILAALWFRALARDHAPRTAARRALGLSVVWAGLDEALQGLAPSRTASLVDVLVDALGALGALGALQAPAGLAHPTLRLLQVLALGVALGSLAGAILDWALALPAWDLVLAACGAGAATWGLRALRLKGRP
jgi:hypothetical protein